MEKSGLIDILTESLRDIYDAEKQLTKALPKMAKAADDEELAQGFRDHAGQTQEQVRRLEQVFEHLGQKARSKPCMGMRGLIEEGQEVMDHDMESSALDLALSEAGRKVEHYEMAAYESLIAGAQAAKQTELIGLLRETLKEEQETDKRLATLGKRLLKEMIASSRQSQEESGSEGTSSRRTSGRGRAASNSRGGNRTVSRGANRGSGRSGEYLSNVTSDPDEIRRWAEERGGRPACVRQTGGKGDIGMLRLEFPGKPNARDEKLQPITWEEFFDKFQERGLALVYQEHTSGGQTSNFNKIISRERESRKPKTRAAR